MEQVVFLKPSLETVIVRGQIIDKKYIKCKRCRTAIEYVAAKMQVWKKNGDGVICNTKTFVGAIHPFCPKCDGKSHKVVPGGIIYDDEVIVSPIDGVKPVAPAIIEWGHFAKDKLPLAERVLVRVEKVDYTTLTDVELHLQRMEDPLYAIKWRREQLVLEKKRQKEEQIKQVLASWGVSLDSPLKEEPAPSPPTPRTVTVLIDGKKIKVEI